MNRAERIRLAIGNGLNLDRLEITDESHLHAGHAGAQPGGETHYSVTVVSSEFAGLSRVARQRRIYALLEAEFETGLHALTVRALTPDDVV